MADQKALSSSMDDKKEQGPRQSDEVWSDLANPCGNEFKLPSVSSPLNSEGGENNDDLASPFQLLDPPTAIDENFLEEMIDSFCRENLADCLPILEMAPSVCHTVSLDDEQKGVSEQKKEVVRISDGLFPLDVDIDAFLQNLESDSFMLGSGILQPVQHQSQDISVEPYDTWLGSNDVITSDHAYFCTASNEDACVPITAMTTGFTASAHMYEGLEFLKDSVFTTGVPVNVSISTDSERVTQTHAPLSNFLDLGENGHAFSLDSFQVGHSSSYVSKNNSVLTYVGNDDEREFNGYGICGGPMSFDLKPQMTNLSTAQADPSPITQLKMGHPSVASQSKIEENISNEGKGKLPVPSVNEHAREKMPHQNKAAKEGQGQSNKRLRQGTSKQDNTAENKSSSMFDSPSREISSPASVQKALQEAREAL